MHELSIALAIVDAACDESARQASLGAAHHAVKIHLRLGKLSGVVPAALSASFDLARAGTALEGCALVIQEIPITCRCACSADDRPVESAQRMRCAGCGREAITITGGRDLEVRAMEFIDEPDHAAR